MAHSHAPTYFVIYGALLVLMVLTVAASMVPLGMLAVPVALTIATIKAVLIILFFMHVKDEAPLIGLMAAAGFLWLGLMLLFMMSDYVTREQMSPRGVHPEFGSGPVISQIEEADFGASPWRQIRTDERAV